MQNNHLARADVEGSDSPDSWMGLAGATASIPWKCSLNKRTTFGPFVQNLQWICFCIVSSTGLEHIWLTLTQKASVQHVCVYFSPGNPRQKYDDQFLASSIDLQTLWRKSQTKMFQNQRDRMMSFSHICYFKMRCGEICVLLWNILLLHIVRGHWFQFILDYLAVCSQIYFHDY